MQKEFKFKDFSVEISDYNIKYIFPVGYSTMMANVPGNFECKVLGPEEGGKIELKYRDRWGSEMIFIHYAPTDIEGMFRFIARGYRIICDKSEEVKPLFSFNYIKGSPKITVNQKVASLTGIKKGTIVDFWKVLIKYVVPDSSVQEYKKSIAGCMILRHHSLGEHSFELYPNGGIRGCVNAKRIVDFFEAVGVEFEPRTY